MANTASVGSRMLRAGLLGMTAISTRGLSLGVGEALAKVGVTSATDGDPLELAGLVVTGWEGIQIRWLADGTDPVAAMGTLLSAVLRPAPTASHLHGRRGNQPESVHTSRILE